MKQLPNPSTASLSLDVLPPGPDCLSHSKSPSPLYFARNTLAAADVVRVVSPKDADCANRPQRYTLPLLSTPGVPIATKSLSLVAPATLTQTTSPSGSHLTSAPLIPGTVTFVLPKLTVPLRKKPQ